MQEVQKHYSIIIAFGSFLNVSTVTATLQPGVSTQAIWCLNRLHEAMSSGSLLVSLCFLILPQGLKCEM